jgi:hypothetical protein
MPRRLQRKHYGWSYTYGKDQRTQSDTFKKHYEEIKWNDSDTSEWDTKKNQFGKAKVKRF